MALYPKTNQKNRHLDQNISQTTTCKCMQLVPGLTRFKCCGASSLHFDLVTIVRLRPWPQLEIAQARLNQGWDQTLGCPKLLGGNPGNMSQDWDHQQHKQQHQHHQQQQQHHHHQLQHIFNGKSWQEKEIVETTSRVGPCKSTAHPMVTLEAPWALQLKSTISEATKLHRNATQSDFHFPSRKEENHLRKRILGGSRSNLGCWGPTPWCPTSCSLITNSGCWAKRPGPGHSCSTELWHIHDIDIDYSDYGDYRHRNRSVTNLMSCFLVPSTYTGPLDVIAATTYIDSGQSSANATAELARTSTHWSTYLEYSL